ncbi:leucine-rich repeat-containing protein 15-like [Homalodisca vitripennis]|uniref:leucine-rich repeat-containing protein 15-like n=1 Tax=Homalodisca vitripennis TaxID=197043 RepID=UPI001EEC1367|nr:leucine-rich repeat-containing protein 15-like [Homalodisca vitripennis]
MKICLVVVMGYLAVALAYDEDCLEYCSCSKGMASIARCTQLSTDMLFPERVKYLIVDSVPDLQINLTKGFFREVGLQQLLTIQISHCLISYVDVGAFEGLSELTDVDLSDNGLIFIHRDTFETNSRLERINLSSNPLQLTQLLKAEQDYFLKSSSLLELDLSYCQLSNIDKRLLSQVINLQYINLKSNNIKVIDDYIFENVPLLDEVDLSDNMLMTLNDEIFEDIEELTTLNLRNNLIENIKELDMPGLKELDVSLNNIKLIKKTTFEGVPDLSTLNMSHNKITWISEETFKDLIELRHLDLSHNALIGPLPKFIFEENEYLETLSIGGNNGMHIFEGFSTELPRLYKLDISDCGLHNITNSSFSGMPSLAILNASMNSLTSLNHVMMSKLHRLNTLDLSHNEITKVGAYTFSSNLHLRKLNLSNNKIHHLSPNTFDTTSFLSYLDISNNQLSYVWHANDSEYMKENKILSQLEKLNIAGNKIKDLHKHSFSHLINLQAINIQDNPLECTSEFPAFVEWMYKYNIKPLEHIGKSPAAEEKLEISNLQWDDLFMEVCKPQKTEKIEIKTKPVKGEEMDDTKEHDLNFYQYTVIEDVKLNDAKLDKENEIAMEATEVDELAEEVTSYMWPTFLVIFSIVFLLLAIGNTLALVIYNRNRNPYNTVGMKTAFTSPFKRTMVKLDTTPRYHKLYEECSVPNTPIVKGNLLGNIVNSQRNVFTLSKSKEDNVV